MLTEFGGSATTVTCGLIVAFLYAFYLAALPKPIPGIPYNKFSAKRLLGDISEFVALQEAGKSAREFWPNLARTHASPVTQYFLGPFSKPIVVLSDFRESHDVLLRRGKELKRGWVNRDAWHGVVPEHFIGMEDHDVRFKDSKALIKDLMTPKFLHEVNCPASYHKVLEFIQLWQEKSKISNGRPFDALGDLAVLTYDIILAAALGLDDSESDTARHLRRLETDNLSALQPDNEDVLFPFPETPVSELQQALRSIASAAGASFTQPSPWLFHLFNNRKTSMQKAYHTKKTVVQSYIDRSSQRLEQEGADFKPRSALDYIVSREAAVAEKTGRAPTFDSLRINDTMFGYLIGGQDSTHSTLSFMVKYLGDEQQTQKTLRDTLRQAHPDAFARGEQPQLEQIVQKQIPYLDAFIEEVLRMSDPARGISRETLHDMPILGHVVPKGTMILFSLSGPTFQERGTSVPESLRSESSQKHCSDRIGDWADSDIPANEFRPERWLRPSGDEKGGVVFDSQAGPFLAFSTGPRGCWGKRLAYMELKLVTTLLLWNFVFQQLPSELNDWDMQDELFVRPKHCRVKLRSAWDAPFV